MRVLSLFDGISCARVALGRAGHTVDTYYASEVDANAIKVAQKNYPDTIQLGSVVGLVPPECDLLIGGSPCQDLSIAKKDRKGLDGEHSGLFWEWVRVWKETKPKWWVLENVASMPKKDRDIITATLGVEPVMFNAALVSAQSRKRLFWTNIKFDLPEDRGILLKDILQPDGEVDERMVVKGGKSACIDANYHKGSSVEHAIKKKVRTMVKVGRDVGRRLVDGHRADADTTIPYERRIETREDGKCGTLTSVQKDNLVMSDVVRKLTPIECERLQSLPDNYTEGVAMTHRYRCCGNAFNVEVVAHILRGIPNG
jgi:DNA-cytosine methyltransferase